jgi:hypothetical protein
VVVAVAIPSPAEPAVTIGETMERGEGEVAIIIVFVVVLIVAVAGAS